ncbi:hypothetical protein PRIPAC_89445 [Pristionchus pacificus]|uniref:Uncharacterized protein n=1 Tax=Pristionchus pacificus TaxID=54126 RepID=A0A2A6B8D8_PRIPA|nr:hypothetical protein PRIPAC_89445 [Pristionchus pacificus]|eukprot:PDM62123.1 hypothetical protein PRIPAC_51565 [Pristionchus pacificus]
MENAFDNLRLNFFNIAEQIGPLSPLTLDRNLFAQSLILLGEISKAPERTDCFCEDKLTAEEKSILYAYTYKAVIVFEVLIRRGEELEQFTNFSQSEQILIGIVFFRIVLFPTYSQSPNITNAVFLRMRTFSILIFVIDTEIAFKNAVKQKRAQLVERRGTPPEPDAYLESLLLPVQLDREFFLSEYSLTD